MDFDLVIVGAGTGNTLINREMDGWEIAIIERSRFGGTCLNRGCIPSKMLIYTAELAHHVRHATRFGVDAQVNAVHWPQIVERVFGRIDPIAQGGHDYRESLPNVTVFDGDGRMTGERTFTVDGVEVRGRQVVLAAGARSFIPPIPGLATVPFHTSDTLLRIEALPEHLVIVGGGFIAVELGHVFRALGSKVTIINRGRRLLELEDADIANRFTATVADRYDLVLGASIDSVTGRAGEITVDVTVDGAVRSIVGDTLLVATGRVPNGDELNVGAGGVAIDDRGRVIADAYGRTSAPGVWALGDIIGRHQLKHMANSEGRAIRHNLLHPTDLHPLDPRPAPHAVFTNPQIGSVGLTEAQAIAAGTAYVAVTHDYSSAAFGWALEDTTSFVKLLGDPGTGLLLGAHIIGPEAANLVQLLVQGMHLGATVEQLSTGQIYIHPALTEVVEQALLKLGDAMRDARA
jgi:mycothione reductase